MKGDPREQIQKLLITGDNRLKQGVDPTKVRQSYEQALVLAREAGLEDSIRPLVEVRLDDLARLGQPDPVDRPPQAEARAEPAPPNDGAAESAPGRLAPEPPPPGAPAH